MSTTQGPLNPNSGAFGSAFGGTIDWVDISNAFTENNFFAYVNLVGATTSNYICLYNFGFSIPTGSTINGIVVEWLRNSNNGLVADNSVRLLINNSYAGDEKSFGSIWPTTAAYQSFGGAADLWGLTPTVAQINSAFFGACLSAVSSGSDVAYVDTCRITVYYTPPIGPPGVVTMARRPDRPTDPQFTE